MLLISPCTDNDVKDLRSRLEGVWAGRLVAEIETLNPHVNLDRLAPGAVLLVPDVPETREVESTSIEGQAFAELRARLISEVDAARARVRSGYATRGEEAKDVSAALRSAAIKRAVASDTALGPQVEAAAAVFKQDAIDAKAAEKTLDAMRQRISDELDALAKLLG